MARTRVPEPKGAEWTPEKTIRALQNQLAELRTALKGKAHKDVQSQEREWAQLTESIVRRGFGDNSAKLREFRQATFTASPRISSDPFGGGLSARDKESERQQNFEKRIERFEPVLNSAIRELHLELPEPAIKGSYEPGDEYGFYKDLKGIVSTAQREVFIADNYLDTDVFDLYVAPIPPGVSVRILTSDIRDDVSIVAKKYANRRNFELRTSKEVHDRVIFVDDRCWLVGQSIKDAARKKPTYMVEFQGAANIRAMYEDIWDRAAAVVKS